MAVYELTEPGDDVVQANNYNSNVGGNLNLTAVAGNLAPLTSWTAFGLLHNIGVTPENLASNVIPDIIALPGVVDVPGDQLFGTAPAAVLMVNSGTRLYVTSNATGIVSGGIDEQFNIRARAGDSFPLTDGDIWSVMILTVPDELNTAEITALQLALKDVVGIRLARHVSDGNIPERATLGGNVSVNAHMRIEPMPEEPEV